MMPSAGLPIVVIREEDWIEQEVPAALRQALEDAAPHDFLTQMIDNFYPVHSKVLYRFLRRFSLTHEERLDLIHDAWLAVVDECPLLRSANRLLSLRNWLLAVVKCKGISALRRTERRTTRAFDDLEAIGTEPADSRFDPAEQLDHRWHDEMVHVVLHMLRQEVDDTNYQVFFLLTIEERSVAEVAETFRLTREAVRVRHHRMARKFKALLALYAGDSWQSLVEEFG